MSTQCQHKLVYFANRWSALPLLCSSDSSSLLQPSNCLGGSQQECGRLLALPFLAKLCASTAAVPASPPCPALHARGLITQKDPMLGTPHKASLEADGKPQGRSRKVVKVKILAHMHVAKSLHLSRVFSYIWTHRYTQECFHNFRVFYIYFPKKPPRLFSSH